MRNAAKILLVATSLLLSVACASEPSEEIESVDNAMDAIRTDMVRTYAPGALKDAETAAAEFHSEIARQREKFAVSRRYDHALELARIARDEAQNAREEAVEAKDRMFSEARAAIDEARLAIETARGDLGTAPVGKGNRAEIEAMKSELDAAEAALEEMEARLADESYIEAKSMAEEARATAARISASVRAAREMKAAGGHRT